MKFDLNLYRKENEEQFKGKDLDSVARHIYDNVVPAAGEGKTYSQTGKFSDYNDFLAKSGLRDQIAAERNVRNAPDRPGASGVLRDIGNQSVRTFMGATANVVEGVGGIAEAFGSAAERVGGSAAGTKKFSNSLHDSASNVRRNVAAALPESRQMLRDDGYRGTMLRGTGGAFESVAPMAVATAITGGAGHVAKIGSALTGAGSMGFAAYAREKRSALENGRSELDANIHGALQGGSEFFSELIGDLAYQYAGPSAGAITSVGRKALQGGLSGLFRTTVASSGKEAMKTLAVEGGSELINTFAQAEFANAAGLGQAGANGKQMSGIDAVRDAYGEIGVSTMVFALLGVHASHRQRQDIKSYLTNPNIAPEHKVALAQDLAVEMNKLDSIGKTTPGTIGTEFAFSVERQLRETGNVSLNNNMDYESQFGADGASPDDVRQEASSILSEPARTGAAPLGMATSDSLPVDITNPTGRASHPLDPGRGVDDGDPGPSYPGDLYDPLSREEHDKHNKQAKAKGGDVASVEKHRRQEALKIDDGSRTDRKRDDGSRTEKYPKVDRGYDTEDMLDDVLHADSEIGRPTYDKQMSDALSSENREDAEWAFKSASDYYNEARAGFVKSTHPDSGDSEAAKHFGSHLKRAEALRDTAKARFELLSQSANDPAFNQPPLDGGFSRPPRHDVDFAKPTPGPPSSPPVQRDSATYSVSSGISSTERAKPSMTKREPNSDPALSGPPVPNAQRRTNNEDIDTHPGTNAKIAGFAASRPDQSVAAVAAAAGSKKRVDASWAAVTAKHRSNLAWSQYKALEGRTDKESKEARARFSSEARAYAALHEKAMGRFERGAGEDFSKHQPTALKQLPASKRYKSKGDDQSILRRGVVSSVVRFMNSHNLTMHDVNGVPHISKRTSKYRNTDSSIVESAYDRGYIYDKNDLNPHANYSSGVVGGLPIKTDLYWRNSDSLASVASNVDFSGTRVGAHRDYNKSLSTGNSADAEAANAALDKFYADNKASKGDSRPNEIITRLLPDGKEEVEAVWNEDRTITAASADEIHTRAAEGVSDGTFKGRIREFTDSNGDRVLRIIHDRSSPSKFEDFKVIENTGSAEAARERADNIKDSKFKRDILPRQRGTRANAIDVVDKMLDALYGELGDGGASHRRIGHSTAMRSAFGKLPSHRAQGQIDLINNNREDLIDRIQRQMLKENVTLSAKEFLDKNSTDSLLSSIEESSESDDTDVRTSNVSDGEEFTASRLDQFEHTETSAAAAIRGSKGDNRSEISHRAREIYNMTPGQQAEWLREYTGDKKLGSTPATHEMFVEAVEDGIGRLVERRAEYNKYLKRSDITDTQKLEARIERDGISKKISEAYTLIEAYNNLIEEQAISSPETDPDDAEDGVGHNLEVGTLNRVKPGHITLADAYALIESKTARPEFKNGRLYGVSYWDSTTTPNKDGKGSTTVRNGKINHVPIDYSVNEHVLQAQPNANSVPGQYDRAAADDLAVKLITALNVDPAHANRIHYVTAQELFDRTGLRDGLDGAAGLFNPNDGNSYIITDNITSVEEFGRVVLHEVGAHAGLMEIVPDRGERLKLLDQLASNQVVVDWFIADGHASSMHMANYANLSDRLRLHVGNEMLAAIFQTMKLDKRGNLTIGQGKHKVGGIVDAVVAFVQRGIQRVAKSLGINMRMTNAQVRNLIAHIVARNGAAGVRTAANAYHVSYNGYNNLATWQLSKAQMLRRELQDHAVAIKLMQDSITNMGRTILTDQDVHAAISDSVNTTAVYLKRFEKEYAKPLIKAIADSKVDYKRLDMFIVARHALERNAFHSGKLANASGWTDAEANAVINSLVADGLLTVTHGPSGTTYGGTYGDIGRLVQGMADIRLDILYHGNMLTRAEYDNVKRAYKYYVPMTDTENLPSTVPGIGGSSDRIAGGKDVKNIGDGRSAMSTNGIAQMVHAVETSIRRVEQNKVYQHFDRLIAANPNANAFTRLRPGTNVNANTPASDGILSVKYNGVERLILLHNKDLARALKGGTPRECGVILNVMRKFSSFFVRMNVAYSPQFPVVNQARDTATAFAHLASRKEIGGVSGMDIFKRTGKVYKDACRFAVSRHLGNGNYNPSVDVGGVQMSLNDLYTEFENSGAKPGFVLRGSIAQGIADFEKECELAMSNGVGSSAVKFAHAGARLAESIGEASESSTRFAAFIAMRQSGLSAVVAGREAKELTVNFARRGESTSAFNAIYPFFNANVQDGAMMVKLMFGRGVINKQGLAVAASIGGFTAMLVSLARAAGEDEDGTPLYDKLTDFDRTAHFVFPPINGKFVKIPLPYSFGVFASVGRILADLTTKEAMGAGSYSIADAGKDLVMALMHSFNPVGGEINLNLVGFGHAITPQIGKVPYELATNQNNFGAPIRPDNESIDLPGGRRGKYGIPEKNKLKDVPDHLNHTANASWLSKDMANALSKAGFETSPDNIDHTFKGVFGAAGKFVMQSIAMIGTGTSTPVNGVPIVRRFLGTPPDYVDTRSFKSNVNDIKATTKEYDRIRLDPAYADDVKRFEADNAADLKAGYALKGYEERLHKLSIARKVAKTSEAVQKSNEGIRRLHQQFNAHYYSLQAQQE